LSLQVAANYRYFAAVAENLHLRRLADAFEARAEEISALATWQNGTPISVSPESPPTSASCSLPRPLSTWATSSTSSPTAPPGQ
jgi:rubrerythrin